MPCATFLDCLPVLILVVVMVWSYYVYVVEVCIFTNAENLAKQILYLVGYHIVLLMSLWTYLKVMCTDIAVVPNEFKLPPQLHLMIKDAATDSERNRYLLEFCTSNMLPVVTRTEEGNIRFCNKCKHVKPDRAHHCSHCGTCILKMDHHCPWVNNCIGFSNYKFFVQLLFYSAMYCLYIAGTTLEFLIRYVQEPSKKYRPVQITILFCLALGFGVLMTLFCCYHLLLIFKNETTLESMTSPVFRNFANDLSFDLGKCDNFTEVLGENCCLWCIPIDKNEGDGVDFPLRMTF